MRHFAFIATLVLAVSVAFYFWRSNERPSGRPEASARETLPEKSTSPSRAEAQVTPRSASSPGREPAVDVRGRAGAMATAPWNEADFPIVAPLNAPSSTIARDLDVVQQLFENWRSNFPREGNPVGENADITAALMGDNPLKLALIPKGHRAVNERGELCDRWGTPFRFHQISGTQMEVRSAGPDRKFATDDDAVWTPP